VPKYRRKSLSSLTERFQRKDDPVKKRIKKKLKENCRFSPPSAQTGSNLKFIPTPFSNLSFMLPNQTNILKKTTNLPFSCLIL
jgi:hypothetical protein